MADFDEIRDVGAKVREKYNQDPSQDDWFNISSNISKKCFAYYGP